jgi:hypothetical protein
MNRYTRPTVIHTYSIAELCADAAHCTAYVTNLSDRNLKQDIETIENPLERMRSIDTN